MIQKDNARKGYLITFSIPRWIVYVISSILLVFVVAFAIDMFDLYLFFKITSIHNALSDSIPEVVESRSEEEGLSGSHLYFDDTYQFVTASKPFLDKTHKVYLYSDIKKNSLKLQFRVVGPNIKDEIISDVLTEEGQVYILPDEIKGPFNVYVKCTDGSFDNNEYYYISIDTNIDRKY